MTGQCYTMANLSFSLWRKKIVYTVFIGIKQVNKLYDGTLLYCASKAPHQHQTDKN